MDDLSVLCYSFLMHIDEDILRKVDSDPEAAKAKRKFIEADSQYDEARLRAYSWILALIALLSLCLIMCVEIGSIPAFVVAFLFSASASKKAYDVHVEMGLAMAHREYRLVDLQYTRLDALARASDSVSVDGINATGGEIQ